MLSRPVSTVATTLVLLCYYCKLWCSGSFQDLKGIFSSTRHPGSSYPSRIPENWSIVMCGINLEIIVWRRAEVFLSFHSSEHTSQFRGVAKWNHHAFSPCFPSALLSDTAVLTKLPPCSLVHVFFFFYFASEKMFSPTAINTKKRVWIEILLHHICSAWGRDSFEALDSLGVHCICTFNFIRHFIFLYLSFVAPNFYLTSFATFVRPLCRLVESLLNFFAASHKFCRLISCCPQCRKRLGRAEHVSQLRFPQPPRVSVARSPKLAWPFKQSS